MKRWSLSFFLLIAACGGPGGANGARPAPPDPLDTVTADELFRRGVILGRHGDYVRAEQYIAAAVERGYDEERAMPELMRVCIESSRLVAALSYAEPYLLRHPMQWSLRLLVASIRMGMDQHDIAREELHRVLRDAPNEPPEAHYFLGVLNRDRFDDDAAAQEHFRRYLALAPDGNHREEALAALPPAERGLPQRIEVPEEPSPTPAPPEEATP